MPDCLHCNHGKNGTSLMFSGKCQGCGEHRAEVQKHKHEIDNHVHVLYVQIVRPGILRGAV